MIIVKVRQEIIEHCTDQIKKYDFGKRFSANGNKEQQLTGIIGQSVVSELLGFGLVDGSSGFDDGSDVNMYNLSIDIKTMGRTTDVRPTYTNNFLKLQDYFNTDVYIFCSFHKVKKEITICGWIDKINFKNKRRFYKKGSVRKRFDGTSFKTFADLYEIDIKDLNNFSDINVFKQQIKDFSGERR